MSPSIWQILIILLIVILLFGTKRLGNLGSDLGKMIKGFKSSMDDDKGDNKSSSESAKVIESDETVNTTKKDKESSDQK